MYCVFMLLASAYCLLSNGYLFICLLLLFLVGVCTVWWVIQDSQGDQPMADGTFLSKIKTYLSIYLS